MSRFETGEYKIIYAYEIPNSKPHQGCLKIGDATLHTDETDIISLIDNCQRDKTHGYYTSEAITEAANSRIRKQVTTSGVSYNLVFAALAVRHRANNSNSTAATQWVSFRDHDLHKLMLRHGVQRKQFDDINAREWFEIDVAKLKEFFSAIQSGDHRNLGKPVSRETIVFREEQKKAVKHALKNLTKGTPENPKKELWSAIMRFGKTLTSYQLVNEHDEINKVLIITHRPVVGSGWYEDFNKIFDNNSEYSFSSKKKGEDWDSVKDKDKFCYFASIQDLRGSFSKDSYDRELVKDLGEDDQPGEGKDTTNLVNKAVEEFSKNEGIFNTEWDLVIVDESHEGTTTKLAEKMSSQLQPKYWLHLSGTPFNISDNFADNEVYTWDYIEERKAANRFAKENPNEPSPYDSLPEIEFFVYDITKDFKKYGQKDGVYFSFSKFFETKEGKTSLGSNSYSFVREDDVTKLLNLMTTNELGKEEPRYFPYNSHKMKEVFSHTLWMLPTVSSAQALEKLLNKHSFFGDFEVINVAGNNITVGGKAFNGDSAVDAVHKAIKNNKYTITLSVGRLATGTTVPEWTAVFLLNNMKSPMTFMQTAFRSKSGGILPNGQLKKKAYVFDFAPDRTLEMIGSVAVSMSKAKKKKKENDQEHSESYRETVQDKYDELLDYLGVYQPVISDSGNSFRKIDSIKLSAQLKRVFIRDVCKSGFENRNLYDYSKLLHFNKEMAEAANELQKTVGKQQSTGADSVVVNSHGYDEAAQEREKELDDKAKGKDREPPQPLTDEEKEELKRLKKEREEARRNANDFIKVLNSVSVRIPLLVFAIQMKDHNIDHIDVNNFPQLIDDKSWEEFMPRGFTKGSPNDKHVSGKTWEFVKQFYDAEIFEGSVQRIIDTVIEADRLNPLDRVFEIAKLFGTFKNPDKETVLTPWKVVNLQYAETLGGLRWVDSDDRWYCVDGIMRTTAEVEDYDAELKPVWIETEYDDTFWTDAQVKILDINSKTALYPLYAAASLFWLYRRETPYTDRKTQLEDDYKIWKEIAENNIFVNCRVPYSTSIAQRVLGGVRDIRVNNSVVDILDIKHKMASLSLDDDEKSKWWKLILNPINYTNAKEYNVDNISERFAQMANKEELSILEKELNDNKVDLFSAVVSNPPYQDHKNTSIYQNFFDVSHSVSSRYVSFIHKADFVFSGSFNGSGFENIKYTLFDKSKINTIYFTHNSSDVFPNTSIDGGICFYLLDQDKKSFETRVKNISSFDDIGKICYIDDNFTYISNENAEKMKKITRKTSNFMSDMISTRKPYGFSTMNKNELSIETGDYVCYGYNGKGYVSRDKITKNTKSADAWKVYFSKADGAAVKRKQYIGTPNIAPPGTVLTETYHIIGMPSPDGNDILGFDTEDEAKACVKYIKTRFYRDLIKMGNTKHNFTKSTYRFVPRLDFKSRIFDIDKMTIDWSQSIENIEKQLFKMFDYSIEEVKDIEANIIKMN